MSNSSNLDDFEQKLLAGWEEMYKKGQLTLWILLALKDGNKHMAEIKSFITAHTKKSLTADDKSMYRALRRYYDADLVGYVQKPGKGPDIKMYHLTPTGQKVLAAFLQRNIVAPFYDKAIKALIVRKDLLK